MADREHSSSDTDGPDNDPGSGDEFGAALAEMKSGLAAPPADDAGSAGENGTEDQQGSAEDSAQADDAQGDNAPGNDAAPASDAAPDGDSNPPAQDTTDDIWAKAPPELRAAHEKELKRLEQLARTWEGRTNSARAQLRELSRGKPKQQDGSDAQSGNDKAEADAGLSDEEAAKLREDYPELAGPILDRLKAQEERIAELTKGHGEIVQERTQAELAAHEAYLTQQHPDWAQAATDDRFQGWLGNQPRALREAFERNRDAIVDGEDAAFLIGKFKSDVGFGKQAPARQEDPKPEASEKRRRQLESGRDAGRGGPAISSGIPENDFDAALAAAKRKRQRAGTG